MSKKRTFAEEANRIKEKYYKIRKPNEDSMTDEAFNLEMKELMMKQEAAKSKETQNNSQFANQEFAKGGKLNNYVEQNPYNDYLSNPGSPVDQLNYWKQHFNDMLYRNKSILNTSGDERKKYEISDDKAKQNINYAQNALNSISEMLSKKPTLRGKPVDVDAVTYAKGGGLPKYEPTINGYNGSSVLNKLGFNQFNYNPDLMNGLNTDFSSFGQNAFYQPNEFSQQGFDANITPSVNLENPSNNVNPNDITVNGEYTPRANILGPLLTTATSAISSGILANRSDERRKDLLKNLNFGRVSAQQIDLGRERTNIRSNQALTESAGRYVSRGASSASEAANIQNMARLGAQRTSGNLLGQSYQREELTNAQLRAEADRQNQSIGERENQARMSINSQYGNVGDQVWSDFAKSTGQSIANYLGENQRMIRDYDYLQMYQPNLTMQYNVPDNNKWLYDLGILQAPRNIQVRKNYGKKQI